MEDLFDLPVVYNGEELEFKTRLVISHFVYKFLITVNDTELIFERDDEGEYRVLDLTTELLTHVAPDLLQAIIASLKQIS